MFRGVFTPIIRRSYCVSLPMVFWPVVMLKSRDASCVHCEECTVCIQLATRLVNITTATTGQKTVCSENAVRPPDDGRKDARYMLRNNWLTIKSLIVASSWSRLYLLNMEFTRRNSFTPVSTQYDCHPTDFHKNSWKFDKLWHRTVLPNFTKTQQTVWSLILGQWRTTRGRGVSTRFFFLLCKGRPKTRRHKIPKACITSDGSSR